MNRTIKNFRNRKILVVGDVMLDKYISGYVERVSPEAPVPVVKVRKESYVPGGAANVASNIESMSGRAFIAGIVGKDSAFRMLKGILKRKGIDTSGLIVDSDRPTTQKVRITAHGQQLARVDYENGLPAGGNVEEKLIRAALRLMKKADCAIISDYAKGAVTGRLARAVISEANRLGKPVIADPKPKNIEFYRNATLITPNAKESMEMTGVRDLGDNGVKKMCVSLSKRLGCHVLVTRGPKGMSLFEKNGKMTHILTQAKEVYDVSGAGDTVVSAMALALASGSDLNEAAVIANHAAGIVVGKKGTAACTVSDIMGVFEKDKNKVKSVEEIREIIKELKRKKKMIILTNGCFDILHIGHAKLLQEARKQGDVLIVGMNSDSSVKKSKGPKRPIINQYDRAEIISALACVDYIVFFDERSPINIIKEIKPDVIVKGSDYKGKFIVGSHFIRKTGGRVELIEVADGASTTNIIKRILETYNGKE